MRAALPQGPQVPMSPLPSLLGFHYNAQSRGELRTSRTTILNGNHMATLEALEHLMWAQDLLSIINDFVSRGCLEPEDLLKGYGERG